MYFVDRQISSDIQQPKTVVKHRTRDFIFSKKNSECSVLFINTWRHASSNLK